MAYTIIERAIGNLPETVKRVERREPRQVTGRVDIEKVIFPLELKYLYELENHEALGDYYKKVEGIAKKWDIRLPQGNAESEILASGNYIRLSRGSAESIFTALDYCSSLLGVDYDIKIFKGYMPEETRENASIITDTDGSQVLTFDNNILRILGNDNEIRFVIGHELGHLITPKPTEKIHFIGSIVNVTGIDMPIPPEEEFEEYTQGFMEALKNLDSFANKSEANANFLNLMSCFLPKTEELTADRFGLICCGNKEDAITASMKLHCGPDDPFTEYLPKEIIEQASAFVEKASKEPELMKMSDYFYASHPHPHLRGLCMDSFANSDTFQSLFGERGVDDSRVNEECEAFYLTFNGLLPKKSEAGKEVKEEGLSPEKKLEVKKQVDDTLAIFEFICFIIVATADERITPAEEEFYYKRFSRISIEQEKDISSLDDKAFDGLFSDLAGDVSKMHGRTKTSLIKRLFGLVRADHKISDIELQVLMEIAKAIGSEKSCERILTKYYGYLPVNI